MTNRTQRLDELLRRIQRADAYGYSSSELLAMLGDLVREVQRMDEANVKMLRNLRSNKERFSP